MQFQSLILTAITTASLLLTGCVGYVPSFSNKPISGRQITRHDADFIVPGTTTRAAVIRILGTRYRESQRIAAMGYGWEMPAGSTFWLFPISQGWAGDADEFSRWHALFLAFDSRSVVTRKEFVILNGKLTLDEQLEKWVGWMPSKTPLP